MQKKPRRKQWFNIILLSSAVYVSATTTANTASTPISASVGIYQTLAVSSAVTIDNNNNDELVNVSDGTQFTMTISSNDGLGVCIEATSGGLVHTGDADTLTHYQVMCSDITSETGDPIAFTTFDSDGHSTWLETTHTFYEQSSHCDIVLDEPLDEMYHGDYSSTLTYNIYAGTCTS